jgi:hypothetical protein
MSLRQQDDAELEYYQQYNEKIMKGKVIGALSRPVETVEATFSY